MPKIVWSKGKPPSFYLGKLLVLHNCSQQLLIGEGQAGEARYLVIRELEVLGFEGGRLIPLPEHTRGGVVSPNIVWTVKGGHSVLNEWSLSMACATHAHDCADHDCAASWSLYKHIDSPKIWALNEAVEGSAKSVFKSWERRLEFSNTCLRSNEDDPELILFIPFTSDVKIKGISIIGGPGGTSPRKMRAFINREDVDFSNAEELSPVQEWDLTENPNGELEYQTKFTRFQGVASLTLHFPLNFGADATEIQYIGLRGEATSVKRDAVTTIVYEISPNPSDHKTPNDHMFPRVTQS
ncbi:hypothetical protein R1flu_022581 [Riccia fluitans]|uniref:PITH domain-containing protein n=1 Tax=Riccia fluitans TaxID=41844 RepID=A0ABD1XQ37_9MARC